MVGNFFYFYFYQIKKCTVFTHKTITISKNDILYLQE